MFRLQVATMIAAALAALALPACTRESAENGKPGAASATSGRRSETGATGEGNHQSQTGAAGAPPAFVTKRGSVLMLSQARFEDVTDPKTGKTLPRPQPARLVILRWDGDRWVRQAIDDPESNVFHKAIPFRDPLAAGRGLGILTIAGQQAAVKVWYPGGDGWSARTLWKTSFGGRWNRFRDCEIGDVTGDGKADIALATHDQGVVAVLQQTQKAWKPVEIDRKKRTFVHEIELADLDGDGLCEIYATPSQPNRLNGKPQPGAIVSYHHAAEGFTRTVVEEFPLRHVKEILAADLSGDGRQVLLAAVEAEMGAAADAPRRAHETLIKRYTYHDGAYHGEVVATLPDTMCRFLVAGDVDGDGEPEVIAATRAAGLYLLRPGSPPWPAELIDAESGGFEHATVLGDLDGNGVAEIYVAADRQHELRRYVWDGKQWQRETLVHIDPDALDWNVYAAPPAEAAFGR